MRFTEKEINALDKIIKMYIQDEQRDYEELNEPRDHIYHEFKLLENKLLRKKKTVIKV
tara:strand:+ start:3517 stop:3690 length:174 start_codon:yes stop_codon:yes gene_type:complete